MSKSITEQILQHVKVHGPCSYTELNKVYKSIGYGFIFPEETLSNALKLIIGFFITLFFLKIFDSTLRKTFLI